jgi:hypothetical protein
MINVNQITSQLARMPDQALQQYAMMHKNDPYTVSLALSESNRRKQMRDAAQGQQGMAPQPKVVDQGIAGMMAPAPQPMPEDVGIGALPAPNMQGMAGGGIVAFGGGGDVQRFQTGGVPRVGSHGLAAIIPDKTGYEGMGIMEFLQAFGTDMLNKLPTEEKVRLQQNQAKKEAAAAPSMQAYRPRPTMEAGQEAALYEKVGLMPSAPVVIPPVDTGVVGTQTPAPGVKTPPVAGPRPASAVSNKPPVAPVAPAAQAGLGDLATTYSDILKKQDFKDPAEARLGALEAKERAAAEDEKAALLRDQAKFDDAYKGREKRLSDRELDIGKQKDTNTGLAFLNAGLAIMSTPGGLATAIGKGAQVGTAQFAAGLDKIRSAQERLDDARDKMEDLKLNRAEMSAKQIRDAEKDIRNVGIDAEKRGIDGLRMAADVNRKTAADMFKATVDVGVNRERMESAQNIAEMQEKGQSSRSAAQIAATLNTPDRLIFNKLLKDNNNDAVAAATALQKLKTEKFSVTTSYADYLKSFAGKDTLTPPLSFANYAAQFGATLPR